MARYPNHVWSVDRTRVWRWGIWPAWVGVTVEHFSRSMTAVSALEGPNAGWVVGTLEESFLRHGPPKHIIADREGIFASDALRGLLSQWNARQRFGAVGKRGSIAVTERAVVTLKQEWLRRVPVIRGLGHLKVLLSDFSGYYSQWRGRTTVGGATPFPIHRGDACNRLDRSAKIVSRPIEQRFLPDARVTAFRLGRLASGRRHGPLTGTRGLNTRHGACHAPVLERIDAKWNIYSGIDRYGYPESIPD